MVEGLANAPLSMKLLMISAYFHALTHPSQTAQIRSHSPKDSQYVLICWMDRQPNMLSTVKLVKIQMLLDYSLANVEKKIRKKETKGVGNQEKMENSLTSFVKMWNAKREKFVEEEDVSLNAKKDANHGKQTLMANVLTNVPMWNAKKVKYASKESVLLMNAQLWNAQKEKSAYWEPAEK